MLDSVSTQTALWHFAVNDTRMHDLCRHAFAHTNPPLFPSPKRVADYFPTLVNSIVSQQISTKAAAAIFKRLNEAVTLTPEGVQSTSEETIRNCGVTKQKTRYISQLAQNWPDLHAESFTYSCDAEIITRLRACYGIGTWTAEMFLLFAMARSDVFSVGDLGLRQQVSRHYDVAPTDYAAITNITTYWSPYRSIASLVLWHEIDNGPVLL
jgi:DNA-3-methyladenine glycosylase II